VLQLKALRIRLATSSTIHLPENISSYRSLSPHEIQCHAWTAHAPNSLLYVLPALPYNRLGSLTTVGYSIRYTLWFKNYIISSFQEWAYTMARRPSSVRPSVCKLLRKSLLLTDKWPDRYQTFTRWTPGQHASRVCSKSRSRSRVTWYANFLGFLEWATPSLTVWFLLLQWLCVGLYCNQNQ